MSKIYAVLIDTVSIQKYVFGSNKLKENLGASYLVQDIYETVLASVLKEIFNGEKLDLERWKNSPDELLIKHKPFEVGFIGGGNALLFFQDSTKAAEFIQLWTKTLLIDAPGITTAVAEMEIASIDELKTAKFKEIKEELFGKLRDNKSRYIPQTVISRHGITSICTHSGFSMETWNDSEQEYVSALTNAKIEAAKKGKKLLEELYKDILSQGFIFTDELEELGQKEGQESHIAIVHIDGNEMGNRFQKQETLLDIRRLSHSVEQATKASFNALLNRIVERWSEIADELDIHYTGRHNLVLPIRPIILGGDDVTFVCAGRLGIYFARLFMDEFSKQKVSYGGPLTSCAGVAITKPKFPFFRGYNLAEELCKSAKEIRLEKAEELEYKSGKELSDEEKGSWIDFHITYGGFSGTLKDIRKEHYLAPEGNLIMRPYLLNSNEEYGFNTFIGNTRKLKNEFPNFKIKELRSVLNEGEEYALIFVEEQRYRGRKLPEFQDKNYHKILFDYCYLITDEALNKFRSDNNFNVDGLKKLLNKKFLPEEFQDNIKDIFEQKYLNEILGFKDFKHFITPYFDMIEFMEFYPEFELKRGKED